MSAYVTPSENDQFDDFSTTTEIVEFHSFPKIKFKAGCAFFFKKEYTVKIKIMDHVIVM